MEKLIVFALFVGFSIVSSLMKTAKEKREREKALARRRAGGVADGGRQKPKKSVQNEIESFLSDVGDGRATPKASDESRRRKEQEEAKRRKQQAIRRRQQEASERKRQQKKGKSQSASNRPKPRHEERKVHETVAQSVESHLGKRSTEMPRSTPLRSRGRKGASAEIFAMLQDSDGVRNAIIVNEILGRPKSLRDSSRD
ncbi:MAG: hypothetical protein ABJZ55_00195 [Fuerstiella sp.]